MKIEKGELIYTRVIKIMGSFSGVLKGFFFCLWLFGFWMGFFVCLVFKLEIPESKYLV